MFERRDRERQRRGERLDVDQLHLSKRTPDLGKDPAETGKLSTLTNFQVRLKHLSGLQVLQSGV